MIDVVIATEQVTGIDEEAIYLHQIVFNRQSLQVQTPAVAVANRMVVYGLKTVEEAIAAIAKEHVTRMMGLGADVNPDPKLAAMGGLRQDVTVTRGTVADLPPAPAPVPAVKEIALAEVTAAKSLAELQAAMAKYLQGV